MHQPKAAQRLCRDAGKSPPCARRSPVVPPGGTGVSPHPSLPVHRLCFAATDRQAPAHRTINYSRAPFLNIDVKSKFPAGPSPALHMRLPGDVDPSSQALLSGTAPWRGMEGWMEGPPRLPARPLPPALGCAIQGHQEQPPTRPGQPGLGASAPAHPRASAWHAPMGRALAGWEAHRMKGCV